ncbi:ParB/RepB/Spo0J family partition protein [Miniphocaeibacter massiliensis]|uniref:ParB/RepB/Spo0J family partition protein n=1 Tax=Miniphocaeibacter massiliensis TaxID=2041841 RepID=UPI000C1C294A|nr:ParB/RepB/Spo0J family partition protein [Miniphocaeibacter massiliensis]
MAKKKGLGKGLEALIPQNVIDEDLEKKNIEELELKEIFPREDQPRKEFEEESLEELKTSILEYGIIQPIVVRKKNEKYEIVAGERRYRAAKLAKLEKVPVRIMDIGDVEIKEISIIENIQREDLNPYEEASAYQELMDEYGYTQQELSEKIGKSRSYIANTIRLLKLDPEILEHLKEGDITSTQARSLLAIEDKNSRFKMLEKLLLKQSNVRDLEKVAFRRKSKDIYQQELEERLVERLGTKVDLKPKKRGGKIEITYMSNDDLERILEIIGG